MRYPLLQTDLLIKQLRLPAFLPSHHDDKSLLCFNLRGIISWVSFLSKGLGNSPLTINTIMGLSMELYDVVIVGAGPAGLSCAQVLDQAGNRVLLIEKNEKIGPKICGGGVRLCDFENLGMSEDLIACRFEEAGIQYVTIDRSVLGQWQAKNLSTNVCLRTKTIVTAIKKDYIIINKTEKIGYRYLVGADGSLSKVRKYLQSKGTLPQERYILIGIQYLTHNYKYPKAEFIVDKNLFHIWYAWIFPHIDKVAMGCCCGKGFMSAGQLKKNFAQWLRQRHIDVSDAKLQGFPINCDYHGYRFDNIFLAGDAAGLASYRTGEGIHQALVSGEEIARTIIDPDYISNPLTSLIKKKHSSEKIYKQ